MTFSAIFFAFGLGINIVIDIDTLFYVVNMLSHTAKRGKKSDFLECSAIIFFQLIVMLSRPIKVSLTSHESKKVGPTTIPEIEGISKKIFGYVSLFLSSW